MKRLFLMSLSLCVLSCGVSLAQPPGGREGRPPRDGAPRDGRPRENAPPPHNRLMDALDQDRDHVISAEEIKSAIASLLKLDRNGDGKLTEDEFRPEHPGVGETGPGRPPREAVGRPRDSAPREGREGPPEGRGPGGPGGPSGPGGPGAGGPPDPASFVEHILEFDLNKDGLMSKEELMKFAEQGMRRGGPGGPGGGNRPEGNRGEQSRPARPTRPGVE